jgi:hypothetical protein
VIEAVANSRDVAHPEEFEQAMAAASEALGPARFGELTDRARAATLGQVVSLVLAWDFASDDESELGENKS